MVGMKANDGRILTLALAAGVLAGSAISTLAGPAATTNPPVQTGMEAARERMNEAVTEGKMAVREGVQKADTAITNAVHQIGVGAHKATDVATNVAAKVKVAVTNAVDHVTAAVKDATR